MRILQIILLLAVVGLGVWLFTLIKAPINFNKLKAERLEIVKQRLIDIRSAQVAYKEVNGTYAGNFDHLIRTVNNDSFMIIKTIGNPDDTTQVVVRDTSFQAIRDALFSPGYPADSLAYIPFSEGKKFNIDAGEIVSNKVPVKVFEVSASYGDIFHDQDIRHYDKYEMIKVGSMTQATTSGNWE